MNVNLSPLSGRAAALWAIGWYLFATAFTLILWRPFMQLSPFFALFAAVAITAARSGAWYGVASSLAAALTITLIGHVPQNEIALRCVAFLVNSSLIIWLGSMLRHGASETQAYQEGIADAVPDAVWSCDPNGKITYINTRALDFLGVYMDEFKLSGWKRFAHPDDADLPHINFFINRKRGNEPVTFECRYRRHDGVFFWFESRAVPILGNSGEIVKWLGTSTNIDSRKRVELDKEQLLGHEREARNEAERTNRMKDEFLATVSHELRTPLNAIVGWIYLLKGEKTKPGELKEGLDAIERNTRVQARLIEDLLDSSRIISGQIRLEMQSVDLPLVIDAAIESVRPSLEAKQLRLKTSFDPHLGSLRGDPSRLQQVIWNLLSNAVKFTPKGGNIDINVERIQSHVEISVADTGEGISPDFIPHLFERFRQADASTTRRHNGLGLGLAIVKELVELHDGKVEARSPGEGLGTTFYVTLPLPAAKSSEIPKPPRTKLPATVSSASSDSTRLDRVKVLIVDDESDSRDVILRILERCGASVSIAESAEEAITKLRRDRYNVLISDIGMPEMDGFELIRLIRRSGTELGCEIPAIALTAFTREDDRKFAMQAGFDMFIAKPVDPAELVVLVERCAARASREMAVVS